MNIALARVVQLKLEAPQRGRILRHFLALSDADRLLRFGHVMNDAVLTQYVEQIDMTQDLLFALAQPRGQLLAVAHLALRRRDQSAALQQNTAQAGELGLSVLQRARGLGLGSRLFQAVLDQCRLARVASLYMHCLASNETMLHIAQKAGMAIVREHGEADAYLQFPLSAAPPPVLAQASASI